jgi:hypothetical protein
MHCEQSVSDPKKSVVSWSPTYGREGDGMAWIKRGSIMVDIQNVERLDKVLKDGSIVARIVGWINEGVVQIPLLNTFWFYDFLRRVNKEWLLKRHPDMVIFEGTPKRRTFSMTVSDIGFPPLPTRSSMWITRSASM